MGDIGTGKTTLVNKICNQKFETNSGGDSVTRDLFKRKAAYGEGFNITDTPGTGNDNDKLYHALCLKLALTEGPINGILVTTKYDRTSMILKNLQS